MTTKFTSFDKFACRLLRQEMQELLAKYGVEANLEFTVGNMKFTNEGAEIKVSTKVKGGKSITDRALEFEAKVRGFTLDETNGRKLVGFMPRSYKYPYVYLNLRDGKRYKCSPMQAETYFKAA